MTARDKKTVVAGGGQRFKSKVPGSPYGDVLGALMSCFLCGRHRPRAVLTSRRMLGRIHLVCGEGCPK